MIYSNSQRDSENVRIVMIVIVLDWDFTCLSFWVAVATVSEGQFTVSLLKSQCFLTYFWRCLHCRKERVACSKRQSWCGSTIQCSRRPNSTSSAKLLSPCLSEAFDIPHLTHFTQFSNYPKLFPHLSISWETLSSSLAPHLIGNLDTFSSLAPSWPLNSTVKTYK